MPDAKGMALRRELLRIGQAGLQRAARAGRGSHGAKGWPAQAKQMAEPLTAMTAALLRCSPDAIPSFAAGTAEALASLAGSAGSLAKGDDDQLVDAAIVACGALDAIGSLAVQAAQSLKRAPPGVAAQGRTEADAAAGKAVEQAGELNYLCTRLSLKLRDAAGVGTLPSALQVAFPRLRGCACCGDSPLASPVPGEPALPGNDGPPPAEPDRGRLRRAFSQFDELLVALALLLALLAAWVSLQLAYFDEWWYTACDDDCVFPGRPAPTLAGVGFVKIGMGTLQPTVTVQWDFCCRNWCMVVWWETFIRSVSVTVNAGPLVNGQAAALRQARNQAPAIIRAMAPPASPC